MRVTGGRWPRNNGGRRRLGPDRDAGAGGEAAQQADPALLADGLPAEGAWRGAEVAGDVAVPGCPDRERTGSLAPVGQQVGGASASNTGNASQIK
jgi:hypothetical protein